MQVFCKTSLIILTILLVLSCTPRDSESVSTPITIPSSSPNNPVSTVTGAKIPSALYTPISNGTAFPLLYEKITPDTAHLVTLIAHRKIDLHIEKLVFARARDVLCIESRSGIRSWDIFNGDLSTTSDHCQAPFENQNSGTGLISSGNQYVIKIEPGALEVLNLLRPSTSLYFYLDGVSAAAFSARGEYLLIAFQNGSVWFIPKSLWETRLLGLEDGHTYYDPDLRPELTMDIGKAPTRIIFSPDNALLAFVFRDQSIQLWNVSDLSLLSTIEGFILPSPDVVGGLSSESAENELSGEKNQSRVEKIAFSANDLILATTSTDNQVRLWDIETGKLLTSLQSDSHIIAMVFSPTDRMLVSLHKENMLYIWGIPPANSELAKVEATSIAVSALTLIPSTSSFPGPTATPDSSLPLYQSEIPLTWPVSMPTQKQIMEARECHVEAVAQARYPERMSYWELENTYSPNSPCDWAILAFAYRSHLDDQVPTPEEGKRAFFQAVKQNPALALTTSLFYPYLNSIKLVEAPPLAEQPIISVAIDYEWSGIGEPSNIQYHIEIDQANASVDKINLNVQAQPKDLTKNLISDVDPPMIQKLGKALTDFLPVRSSFTLQNCTDNYPDWNIQLSFLDGSVQTIKTHESNLFNAGGPWFIEMNGQNYVQFSSALVNAVSSLFEMLGLPLGEPFAMYCSSVDTFQLAFP